MSLRVREATEFFIFPSSGTGKVRNSLLSSNRNSIVVIELRAAKGTTLDS